MPVHYDLKDIRDFKEVCYIKRDADAYELRHTVSVLVDVTMDIGMPELTEGNLSEFAMRIFMFETCIRQLRAFGEKFTKDELRKYIGLKTNAAKMKAPEFHHELCYRMRRTHLEMEDDQ